VRKRILVALAFVVVAGLYGQSASAQLPGNLKIPKVSKPKPAPTPAAAAQPSPSNETPPADAAQPQPNAAAPQATAGETTLVMTRIRFWPETQTSYKGEYNDVWSWIPSVEFSTQGPGLPSGAKYYVEVAQPGGAPWVRLKCESNAGGTGYECGGRNDLEKEGTLATGVFPFAVKMRNPLEGTEKTLFTGRAKVEKTLSSEVGPTSARKFVYYTNQDWNLPIGHVYLDNDGRLSVRFWVRGEETASIEAHLFYKGEEVGLFQSNGYQYGASRCSPDMEFQPTRDAGAGAPQRAKWARMNCPFLTVAVKPEPNAPQWHILGTNPGEYEVRVLRNKRLARTLKFSVGPDGKLVDNRIASGNGMAWDNFLFVPVLVVGDSDGTWDRNAWKTETFYGHPLNGFSWPPQ
jgi:hypothetical protein